MSGAPALSTSGGGTTGSSGLAVGLASVANGDSKRSNPQYIQEMLAARKPPPVKR
jgi:hypothetical protein